MNKAELESKHLSELHALAAKAGVERYRMLPRAELIEKLAGGDGGGSGGGGGGSRGGRPRERSERQSRGGRDRQRGGRDRQRGGGDRKPRSGGGERKPRGGGDRQQRRPESEDRGRSEARDTESRGQAAAPSGDDGGKPKRRRRRRRFRKGGKSVQAGELILAAAGGQSIVYGESRQSCTALLRELAAELSGGKGPDPIALLVDPSPEELADWKREAPKAEIVSAGQDRHAEDALAQAARRAAGGEAVILLIDSVSRLAESFGANVAKDLLAEGRSAGGSGTLTIVAAVELLTPVGDAAPGGLFGELDQLLAAIRLHVAEGLGALIEDDVELALLDPLIEPGAAEDEAPQPVHEAAVGGPDQLLPVLVDVFAERRAGLCDLTADGEVEEIVELLLAESLGDEAEFDRGLLDPLSEVLLVEGEAELSVLEHVVGARLVVPSAGRLLIHVS